MDAYGWFTLGMIIGIGVATLFITILEAMDRQFRWVEALVDWTQQQLPEEESNDSS